MIRLHLVVEGQTEETFVREVLYEPLQAVEVYTDVRVVETSRKHGVKHKGGSLNTSCNKLLRDLRGWMQEDQKPDARFSMMVDYYALAEDCPGHEKSRRQTTLQDKIKTREQALATELGDWRFIPYLQRHEFEALLFSEPTCFMAAYPGEPDKIEQLQTIRDQFHTPEDIDEGRETAPSKRIEAIFPQYNKVTGGNLVALEIGFARIYAANPHFSAWVDTLRGLARMEEPT